MALTRTLTAAQFESLLAALGPDRVEAGEAYELLRLRYVRYFSWEGLRRPEDWADEVFNRVARQLESGEAVRNVAAYGSAVARLVAKEARRAEERERLAAQGLTEVQPDPPDETLDRCFERCLAELPPSARVLILAYYGGEDSERIAARQKLAAQNGISLNSLRNRALRIRDRLEKCMSSCVERDVSQVPVTRKQMDGKD